MKKLFILIVVSVLLASSCAFKSKPAPDSWLPKSITIWNLFDDSKVLEGQIQSFKSNNPWVKIIYKKFVNIEDYERLLINEIAEWRWPDIFAIKNNWVDRHMWKLFPLQVWTTKEAMNRDIFESTFLPVVSKDLIKDWIIYGVSLYVDTLALYYNKQILWDHFNSNKPAETWDELSDQVERLTKKDNSIEGFSLAWIAMWWVDNIVRAMDIFYLLLLQYWAEFVDYNTWRVKFANSHWTVEGTWERNLSWKFALDFYSSFWKSSYKNYSWNDRITARYSESSEVYPFIQWKVAMIFWYSYLYEDLKSSISQFRTSNKDTISDKDIWVVEAPQLHSFAQSTKRDSLASYFPLVVSRNSQNPYLAWDFLIYLSWKQSLIDYNEKTNKASSRLDLLDDQKLDPVYWVFARQSSYAKSYPDIVVDEQAYTNIFSDLIEKVINSKESSQEALNQWQVTIQCLVDKFVKKDEMLEVDCFKK